MPASTASPTAANAVDLDALYTSIEEAHSALRPAVSITPLSHSARLSALTGCEVLLKCEHLQHTGSFKFRGASNKIRLLPVDVRKHGVIAASSGNHGQALALAGKTAGVPVTVYTATSLRHTKSRRCAPWAPKCFACLRTHWCRAGSRQASRGSGCTVRVALQRPASHCRSRHHRHGIVRAGTRPGRSVRRRRRWRDDCRHRCRPAQAQPGHRDHWLLAGQ